MAWRLVHPRSVIARAWRQTAVWVWHDVKLGIAVGVGTVILVAIVWGGEWRHVVIATLAVWATLVALLFLLNLVWNILAPSRHSYWQPRPVEVVPVDSNGYMLMLSLRGTDTTLTRLRIGCLVRSPHGIASRGETGFGGPIQRDSVITLQYPREFPGAPSPVSGEYMFIWQEPSTRGRWEEILRDHQLVTVGQT